MVRRKENLGLTPVKNQERESAKGRAGRDETCSNNDIKRVKLRAKSIVTHLQDRAR